MRKSSPQIDLRSAIEIHEQAVFVLIDFQRFPSDVFKIELRPSTKRFIVPVFFIHSICSVCPVFCSSLSQNSGILGHMHKVCNEFCFIALSTKRRKKRFDIFSVLFCLRLQQCNSSLFPSNRFR